MKKWKKIDLLVKKYSKFIEIVIFQCTCDILKENVLCLLAHALLSLPDSGTWHPGDGDSTQTLGGLWGAGGTPVWCE